MAGTVVRRGQRGPAVAEVRDRLSRLGLVAADPAPLRDPDQALFDDTVDAAVRHFQQQRGITVDGIVGPQTFRRLEEARWRLGDRILSYAPGHLVSGDDVAGLQRRLADLGFDCGRVDGVFGPLTDASLREFQRGVGVDPDGTCGPATFKALDRLSRTVVGGEPDALRQAVALQDLRTGVRDKVVVLDPGHGGEDPGHHGHGLIEAVVVDEIAARVEGRLQAIGTQVLLTRARTGEVDAVMDEAARAHFANDTGADLVLSLHVDAAPNPAAHGVATFYFGDGLGRAYSVLGRTAAELVQDELVGRTDLLDCRSHAKSWDLLRLTRMPAVRLECGYVSHPGDAQRLADPGFVDAVAEGVAAAVVRFFAPQ
ncbi:MAG: N-acetylmuramoyl-L-alanine amidase [Actinomycetota bacterium]|nr:MAG: N-acetylmuramoyl-L-alanine amidase [Actinomycetota bacterium]